MKKTTWIFMIAAFIMIGMGISVYHFHQKAQNTEPELLGNICISKHIASNVTVKDVTNQINGIGTIDKTKFPYIEYTIKNEAKEEPKEYEVILEGSKVSFELKENGLISQLSNQIKRSLHQKEEISGFHTTVKEIYYYDKGQAFTLEDSAVMFLMEDETVEYITLKDCIENDRLTSKGQIQGLSHIKKFVYADGCEYVDASGGSGWHTTFAVDDNHHYYDIEINP